MEVCCIRCDCKLDGRNSFQKWCMKLMELERNQEICCLPCRCNFMVYCMVSIPPFLTNQTKQYCSYCLNTIHKTKALLTILDAEPRRVRESLNNSCQVISFFSTLLLMMNILSEWYCLWKCLERSACQHQIFNMKITHRLRGSTVICRYFVIMRVFLKEKCRTTLTKC